VFSQVQQLAVFENLKRVVDLKRRFGIGTFGSPGKGPLPGGVPLGVAAVGARGSAARQEPWT